MYGKKGVNINNYLFFKKIRDLKGFLNIKPRNQDEKNPELDPCVMPASVPPELQVELIKQQSDDPLKAVKLNKPLLEFHCVYVSKKEFPNLRT